MHHKKLTRLMLSTFDGRVAIFWGFMSIALGVIDVFHSQVVLDSVRFLFYPIIFILIFLRFRVGVGLISERINVWGLINICAFGCLVLYLEVFK
jgi:hypothetical protein